MEKYSVIGLILITILIIGCVPFPINYEAGCVVGNDRWEITTVWMHLFGWYQCMDTIDSIPEETNKPVGYCREHGYRASSCEIGKCNISENCLESSIECEIIHSIWV